MIANGTSIPDLDPRPVSKEVLEFTLNILPCLKLILLFLTIGLSNNNIKFLFNSISIYVHLSDKLEIVSKHGVCVTFLML